MHQMMLGNRRPTRRERAMRVISDLRDSFPEAETIGLYGDSTIEALSEQEDSGIQSLQDELQDVTPLASVSMEAAQRGEPEEIEKIGRVYESQTYVATCVLE